MGQLNLLTVILIALVGCKTQAEVLQPGEDFHLTCSLQATGEDRFITQFYRDQLSVIPFNITGIRVIHFKLISNWTTILPEISNYTNQYGVDVHDGHYRLTITNVSTWDSFGYGCHVYDVKTDLVTQLQNSTQLLIPGCPLKDVFWETPGHKLPDGETVLTEGVKPNIRCVVLMPIVDPMVNITIGRFGEPGSIDITDQYTPVANVSFTQRDDYLHILVKVSSTFKRSHEFSQRSIRDVYCRASLDGVTIEKSVNIKVRSKPDTGACTPSNVSALVGSRNVNLTCLIEAHPTVGDVLWTTPDGTPVDASSNHTNLTVTNQVVFEGLYTTLTITEVTAEDMFGQYQIDATNTEGNGTLHMDLLDKNAPPPSPSPSPSTSPGAAGSIGPSFGVIITFTSLLFWMLK